MRTTVSKVVRGLAVSSILMFALMMYGQSPTLVQSNAAQGSGVSSLSVAFSANNTSGNLIIAFVRMSTTTQTVGLTDTLGNTYTSAVSQAQSTDGHQVFILYVKNIKAGANTVKATFSASNSNPWLAIYEYSGMATTNVLDQTAHTQGSSTSPSSGSANTTSGANELLFGALGLPYNYSGTVTAGSSYILLQQDTSTSRAANEGRSVSATGAYAATVGLSSTANWSAAIATFITQPAITTTSLPNATQSATYSEAMTASGGAGAYSWSISSGSLPSGLSLSSGGTISGTPTATGTSNFTVKVADAKSNSVTKSLSISVAAAVSITTTSLANATQSSPYTVTLADSGGTAPYTWSISSGSLPAGLLLTASTGVISGTPTATGTSSFTVKVTDANASTASKALSIVVAAPVSITTTSLPGGTQNIGYTATLADSGGTAPYTWSVSSGSLPTGLSLTASTGVISGTPTATGTSSFTVKVTDANSSTASKALSIVVAAPVSITTTSLPGGTQNIGYTTTLADSGGTSPYTWSISSGSLPTGLSLTAGTGVISGTPTAIGTSSFTVKVTDANASTASKALSIVVAAPVSITTTSLPGGTQNIGYTATLADGGGTAPYTWSVSSGSLPTGLSLTAGTGVISGTPTAIGTSSFTVKVTDANASTASKALSIVVAAPVSITTTSLPGGTQNIGYTTTLADSGGTSPYTWSISSGSLPTGLSLTAGTGVISGTPTAIGTSSFTVKVTDANASTASKALSIVVAAPVSITTTSLPGGTQNIGYTTTLADSGGTSPYTWSISSGSLPTGLSLTAGTGVISGTPTAIGTSSFTVKVTDANASTASKALSITINPPLTVTTASLAAGTQSVAYSAQLAASGGISPYTWSVSVGTFPAGLSLAASTGAITGTPSATGTTNFTVEATDASANTATKALSITINPAQISPTVVATGSLNVARYEHTETLLSNGQALIVGGSDTDGDVVASAELYAPGSATFTLTGSLNYARAMHTTTLLGNGQVLISGGIDGSNNPIGISELFNPGLGTFSAVATLNTARYGHTATMLHDGRVLIVGGEDANENPLSSAEIYDPVAGTFTLAGNLNTAREFHTATLLNDGMVLIVGGFSVQNSPSSVLSSAELYDPGTGRFSYTGNLNTARWLHTATLLNSGQVLLAGGDDGNSNVLASAELYDPIAGTFTSNASLNIGRDSHTATLLTNGTVLLAGGWASAGPTASTELYDPVAGAFTSSTSLLTARSYHTATMLGSGVILVAGGMDTNYNALVQSELYKPGAFIPAGLVSIAVSPLNASIPAGSAQRLSATGTFSNSTTQILASATWNSSDKTIATATSDASDYGYAYGVGTGPVILSACTGSICGQAAATVGSSTQVVPTITSLSTTAGPVGTPVIISGTNFGSSQGTSQVAFNGVVAVVSNWSASQISVAVPQGACTGSVVITIAGTASNEAEFTVTSAPSITALSPASGQSGTAVAITGQGFGPSQENVTVTFNGVAATVTSLINTQIVTSVPFGAATGNVVVTVGGLASGGVSFTVLPGGLTGNLIDGRYLHTATLLNDGRALIAGGANSTVGVTSFVSSAELYDPTTKEFAVTGNPIAVRVYHTSTLLSNGEVLVVGGLSNAANGGLAGTSEVFDSGTGAFRSAAALNIARYAHSATMLPDGRVLIVGGFGSQVNSLSSAEIYDPATDSFAATGSLNIARAIHTATLLNNGQVLISGGMGNDGSVGISELFDPSTGSFSYTGSLNIARRSHTATLLNSGQVLIVGGFDNDDDYLTSAELYDPTVGTFTAIASPSIGRVGHTATLLSNGTVLVAGGGTSAGTTGTTELYDPVHGTFSGSATLFTARNGHTATKLGDGSVLLAGGDGVQLNVYLPNILAQSELYVPGTLVPSGLVSIALAPSNSSIPAGAAQRFSATGTFSDLTTQTLASASWSSSDNTIATVTDDAGDYGYAYGFGSGPVIISACTGSICGQASTSSTHLAPTITSVSPTVGFFGKTVTVSGLSFGTQGGTVTFNGSPANVTSWTETSIVVSVPSGATTGPVVVTVAGLSSNSVAFAVSDLQLTSLNPSFGPLGTNVTVGGIQFGDPQGSSTVTFNGVAAIPTTWGTQTIIAPVPVGATSGPVIVTVNGVASNTLIFTVGPGVTSINPTSGATGTTVTITGAGFGSSQGSSVSFNGTLAMPTSWSDTQIVVPVPSGATTGNVVVTVNGLPSSGTSFTVLVPLAIDTNSLAVGTQNAAYNSTLTATGGQPPYTWSIIAGGLPSGLSLNGASGVISGTPTAGGSYNITIQVTDAISNTATATQSLNIAVTASTATLLWSNQNPSSPLVPVMLTTEVITTAATAPTGSVVFQDGGASLESVNLAQGYLPVEIVNEQHVPVAARSGGAILYYTTSVGHGTGFVVDLGVSLASGGNLINGWYTGPFPPPQSALYSGSYAVDSNGNYYFSTDEGGQPVLISYVYSAAGMPNGSSDWVLIDGQSWATQSDAVFTPDYATSPLGDQTASRLQLPGDEAAGIYQSIMNQSGNTVTFSLWMQSNTGSNQTVHIWLAEQDSFIGSSVTTPYGSTACTVYTNWQRCQVTAFIPSASQGVLAMVYDSSPSDVSIWGMQVDLASAAGFYAPTAGGSTETIGVAAYSISSLSPGSHTLTAAYGGDSNNGTSTSSAVTQVVVNTASLTINAFVPNGVVGTPYNTTLGVTGGTAPYTWATFLSALPAGLSLDPNAGVISGMPTTAGTSYFVVQVTDSSSPPQSATQVFSLTINPSLAITTTSLATGTSNTPYYSSLLATGGTAPYSWSVTEGSLPGGLALNGWSVYGTPTSSGTSNFSLQVTDSSNPPQTATQPLSISIGSFSGQPLAITTMALANATQNVAYSAALAAAGGVPPYAWSVPNGGLPAGLSLNAGSGSISGTPTTALTNIFTVQVTDASGNTAMQTSSITVNVSLAISTPSLPAATENEPYSAALAASGGAMPYTWSIVGSLPAGMSLNSATGLITGTPISASGSTFTVQATDTDTPPNVAQSQLTIAVSPAGVLQNTAVLLWAVPNPSFLGQQVTFTAQVMPAGGSGNVPEGTVTFEDGGNSIGSGTLSSTTNTNLLLYSSQFNNPAWSLFQGTGLSANYATSPAGDQTAYRLQSPGSNDTGESGGISQQVNGLSGSQLGANTFSIWLMSNTGTNQNVQIWLEDLINDVDMSTTCLAQVTWQRCSVTLPTNTASVAAQVFNDQHHSQEFDISIWGAQLEAANSTGPYVATTSSAASATLANTTFDIWDLASGILSISASYGGDNANNASRSATTKQTVNPVSITTISPLANALVGTPYSVRMTAFGGIPPYTWSAPWSVLGSLPEGLSLDPNTGVLSGIPTGDGNAMMPELTFFYVQATDSNVPPFTVSKEFTLQILSPTEFCPQGSDLFYGLYPNQFVRGVSGQKVTILSCLGGNTAGSWGSIAVSGPPGISITNPQVTTAWAWDTIEATVSVSPTAQLGANMITLTQNVAGYALSATNLLYVIPPPPSQQCVIGALEEVIKAGEGTSGPNGYGLLVYGTVISAAPPFGYLMGQTGTPANPIVIDPTTLTSFPNIAVQVNALISHAYGAYQFFPGTWTLYGGGSDISPGAQDDVAGNVLTARGSVDAAMNGDFTQAIWDVNTTWASLPDSPYGQPSMTWVQAQADYQNALTYLPECQ